MIVSTAYGPQLHDDGSVTFRICTAQRPLLVLDPGARERTIALERDAHAPDAGAGLDTYAITVPDVAHGTRYAFTFAANGPRHADPASRWQPDGVHAPSAIWRPASSPVHWHGRPWHEHVFYELHVGTFSAPGTYDGVIERLDDLAALGITAIELMPLAAFPGTRGWGYDGVFWYAPFAPYGTPADLQRLIDEAHQRSLAVFLDVVYNHFGPEGNVVPALAPGFFDPAAHTPWGAAIDYSRAAVRAFAVDNARYWIGQFGFDGLRLDAVQEIRDSRHPGVMHELRAAVADLTTMSGRRVHVVVENDANDADLLRDAGYEAQWADDVHHALHVLATGERDGYYADYADAPQRHLARALAEGFAYQGDPSRHRHGEPRGTPSADLSPLHFITFTQNHDQVGNRAFGERLVRLAPDAARLAVTAIIMLAPQPPLLFMGEEWAASTPFTYFCDLEPALAEAVRAGRAREFATFAHFANRAIPDATDPATFEASRLRWDEAERAEHAAWRARYHHLLVLRAREIAPRSIMAKRRSWDAQPADPALRVVWECGDELLLLDAYLGAGAPAFAATRGRVLYETPDADWRVRWTIEPNR